MKQHSLKQPKQNMEVQLKSTIVFFLIISTTALLSSTTTGHPFPPPSDEPDYIRTSCSTTRYPETCFSTLSKYSGPVQHDPSRLAMAAIHVALTNATRMAFYVSKVSHHKDSDNTTESAAIHDCSSVFGDAVDEISKSHKEMKRLGWTGESVRFQLSNVQTWMSAALTNEDTCTDGFEDVADSSVKTKVLDRVVAVKEVTSNALALVNSYADTIPV
ncbi:putative pectinesterase [Helianthus annuus]|uniref:Pectinesterase n=1 Tax=Helianthus annuus TaxID=4232 RepID=A0A251T1K4_HELAN|nr:pectinesterase inhibitor 9 [Helianthus annuus]KAF5777250.1 putative pectinesterase [Helianthus annuus]KAJ0488821.1 putative pectinesterase [Helianthus annuus]KAJ0492411.1 putative pectinesterase [Helianthus annuus]KAJ0504665.1 putative pectinesterase [Helianthus annuus]KAJ0674394.1 putative pectinesterase [Helianthus annuus]